MAAKTKRPRGTGRLYHQKGSANWWVQFYQDGKCHRESTGTSNRRQAEAYLRDKIGEASQGTFVPRASQVTVTDICVAKLTSDEVHASDSYDTTEGRWRLHLQPFFGHMKAAAVTTDLLDKYAAKRTGEGDLNGTVNREMGWLRSAYNYALKSKKIPRAVIPHFPMLPEAKPRKGFLRDDQFDALAKACLAEGLYLRTFLEVAGRFAWRKESVLTLTVGQVDFFENTIRLDDSKNDEPVTAKMPHVMRELVTAACLGKSPQDTLLTYPDGSPVLDIRRQWERATKAANLPSLLVHDLCRTGIRNMRRRRIDETVALKIAGRKTESILRRYDIVDEADLDDAAMKMDQQVPKVIQGPNQQLKHSLGIAEAVEGTEEAVEKDSLKAKAAVVQ